MNNAKSKKNTKKYKNIKKTNITQGTQITRRTKKLRNKEKIIIKEKKEKEGKKALIVTTVSGFVPQFESGNVRILQELGYEVHYASNFKNPAYGEDNRRLCGTGIICHPIDMERSPFHLRKLCRAYRQLKELMKEIHFDLIHCHTPVGGALARLAAQAVRNPAGNHEMIFHEKSLHEKTFVIYTAHGFHFYKGAPLVNWLIYYPAERYLAHYTDLLIAINEEDYKRAQRFRLRNKGASVWVNGVGIDRKQYQNCRSCREEKRRELKADSDTLLLLSVGELSKRKNHQLVIRTLGKMERAGKMPDKWKYLIAGKGKERAQLEKLIRKNSLEKKVVLLGYRMDVRELLGAADCFVFPSKQEGLPAALMEAAVAGLPCIAGDIRGCRELLKKEFLAKKNRREEYEKLLVKVFQEWEKRRAENKKDAGMQENEMGKNVCKEQVRRLEKISREHVEKQMREIYTALQNREQNAEGGSS